MPTSTPSRPRVPLDLPEHQHRRVIAEAVNRLIGGAVDCNTTVTLTAGATATTLLDPRISIRTNAILTPRTADAAAALATTWWVPSAGLLTITHANAASVDRTFTVSLLG